MKKTVFIWTLIILTIGGAFMPESAAAQSYPYIMDFEPANTSPANKNSYASLDTITVQNIQWLMPGVHLGDPVVPSGDFFNGSRSARIRLTDNTQGAPGYLEMLDDFPAGIGYVQFNTAMYGSGQGGKLLVWYSIDSGTTWQVAGDTIDVPSNISPSLIIRSIQVAGPVRIKISKAGTSTDRINVDDITITAYGVIANVFITGKSPEGANIPLTNQQLRLHFDHPITMSQGTVNVYKVGGGIQSFILPGAGTILSDSTLSVSGLTLDNNSSYYVLMDDSVVHEAGGTATNMAITDSTYWRFATVDTTPPAPPPVLTQLHESFLACNPAVNMMGVFQQFNIEGGKSWDCSGSGSRDSFCVSMSGGWYPGSSENSNDWLISSLPLDLSEMNDPVLSLWQKKKYEGSVRRTIKISYNYPGSGSPLDSGITWTTLGVPELQLPPANSWTLIDGINLQAYRTTPFYLALTYECADTGAYVLFYDDLVIEDRPLAIRSANTNQVVLKILGPATTDRIRFLINLKDADQVRFELFDLNGRRLALKTQTIRQGKHTASFNQLNLSDGIYLLRATGTFGTCTVKVMVQ